jgi:hypothetical protein
LLIDCWGSNQIWGVSPADGRLLNTYTIQGASDLRAMAWDRGRSKLWICNGSADVYLADLTTQTQTFAFTSQGCIDGLAYDGTDDTIWSSADAAATVQHYKTDGTLIKSTDITSLLGGRCGNSGLAVGGTKLLLSNNGCSEIYIAPKDLGSATLFGTFSARLEDLECDDLTFASQGKAAIWSKDAYDNILNAFELIPGTCGYGGQPSSGPVIDPLVSNVDNALVNSKKDGGAEPTIAVDPKDPRRIVIFSAEVSKTNTWQRNRKHAPLYYSSDGGGTWRKAYALTPPPGRRVNGCPCDTTADWGSTGTLYVSVLATNEDRQGASDVYTASNSGDPTRASDWKWRKRRLIAQPTNQVPKSADQPWVITNPSPTRSSRTNTYVAYDAFEAESRGSEEQFVDLRVADSYGSTPPDFTNDASAGEALATVNPSLRIAGDKSDGTVVALHQDSVLIRNGRTRFVYKLNRSSDGGRTWKIAGRRQGLIIDRATVKTRSKSPFERLTNTQGLLAVAVARDDTVYVVYGIDSQSKGYRDSLAVRHLVPNSKGSYTIGAPTTIANGVSTQLPGIAVLDNGAVGVLYDALEGTDSHGHPRISAHLAVSKDSGASFTDNSLLTFSLAGKHPNLPGGGHRPLGDYSQLKSVGDTFYGTFTASRGAVSTTTHQGDRLDPMFFTMSS